MKNIITRKVKKNKFASNKSYAGFWMNDSNYYNNLNQFSGLAEGAKSSDMVKVIKLASYRRAVSNFVKIVTKKDIPVIFKGTESYTDFDKIVLTTDIKDDNFDVTVGLALHESSHIVHTNPKYLPHIMELVHDGNFPTKISEVVANDLSTHSSWLSRWRSLTNWIEDRRIDTIVFKSSPGYKAYYHKLYDHYWNSPAIDKALKASNAFTNPKDYESYEFRIINCLNPNAKKDALPGLRELIAMIDINNISRLTSVEDSGMLAGKMIDKIAAFIQEAKNNTQSQQQEEQQQSNMGGVEGKGEGEGEGNDKPSSDDDILSPTKFEAEKQLDKQKKFLNGDVNKTMATRGMQNRLESLKRVDVEVQQVGGGDVGTFNALIYNLTKNNLIAEMDSHVCERQALRSAPTSKSSNEAILNVRQKIDAIHNILPPCIGTSRENNQVVEYTADGKAIYKDAITYGLELGALLGRRLQVRNETRELVYNRTRSGNIDKKRLAEAGYGIESIFKQIHVDKYKKGLLHISLDASGSMNGTKWSNTVAMTVAICKAISMTQNMDVTVDLRCTERGGRVESPTCVILYDSRINKLNHLTTVINYVSCNSMTPEGLCTEAMIKRGYYKKADHNIDTFYLNICDGEPGGISGYDSTKSIVHTAKQVRILRNEYNMNILAYYVSGQDRDREYTATSAQDAYNHSSSYGKFYEMYGRGSKYAPVRNMTSIAKHLNDLFLSKGCLV